MDFIDELRQFARKIEALAPQIKTEEATKHSLILPFIQLLGYDVFDPSEVVPELTADVGMKKGEKVDYAIMRDGKVAVLVEAKVLGEPLGAHDSQLFRYFTTTPAKFAILTNGVNYRFYSDLEEPNKMDATPFLEIDMLNLKEPLVSELKKFHKETFNPEALSSSAANLKYVTQIRAIVEREMKAPSLEFCKLILKEVHTGSKVITQNVLDRFQPLIKQALSQFITDTLNDRLKTAIAQNTETPAPASAVEETEPTAPAEEKDQIVTTAEELEGFYTIRTLLRDIVTSKRLTFKDNRSYFAILLDNNTRKWVCRLDFNGTKKWLRLPTDGAEKWVQLEEVGDLCNHHAELAEAVGRHLGAKANDAS